jgi:hypothetical protein
MKQAVTTVAMTSRRNAEREPVTLRKRIGSTTYVVTIRFNANAKETLEQKMLRIISQEVSKNA